MNTKDLVSELKQSSLWAECHCGGEFKLSGAVLFDGTTSFPHEALETRQRYLDGLKKREEDLKKRRKLATKKAEITTKSVNVGKSLEKVLPTLKDFKWELPDCRFLGNPIDTVTFNGLSVNKVDSISFIEVKSGKARLNKHQKSVKDAVEDKKVLYKVFK